MPKDIRKVGIIGAGQMGSGIAHVCALAGLDVTLNDVTEDKIKAGLATINGNLARQVSRQRITEDQRQSTLKKITPGLSFDHFADCDIVIEAVTENEEVKRKTFTHALPVTQTRRDHRFQHLVDLNHPARRRDRPARALHRRSFHDPKHGVEKSVSRERK